MKSQHRAVLTTLAIAAMILAMGRPGFASDSSGNEPTQGSDSQNATFEIQPHVLSANGPAQTSKFVGELVQHTVKKWLAALPAETEPPQLKTGAVSIEFVLQPTGSVTDIKLIKPSGDSALDRAAWSAIVNCGPYPALPEGMKAAELRLRFTFVYNGKPEFNPAPVFK